MTVAIVISGEIEIPPQIDSFSEFRCWTLSGQFPECGRIDFVDGRIEVDTSPERAWSHASLKNEVFFVLYGLVRARKLGHVFVDRMRIVHPAAGLSAEPDVLFISHAAWASGRVQPSPTEGRDDPLEFEGAPDLAVEVVSDSSVTKDLRRLPLAYFAAGVREYWIIDARGDELFFRIYRRGESKFTGAPTDADGYQRSQVFDTRFRLDRTGAGKDVEFRQSQR